MDTGLTHFVQSVLMPRLVGVDLFGSMQQDVANFYAELEAKLEA